MARQVQILGQGRVGPRHYKGRSRAGYSHAEVGPGQRRRNCVKVYITRFVLIRQRCLNCFLDSLDQKTITTKNTNVPHGKVFVIYSEKMMSFFALRFSEVLRIVPKKKKRMTYLKS